MPLQIAEVQSASTPQPLFTAHLAAQEPPQSTSASVPFLTPSSHCEATHKCVVPLQIAEVQSPSTPQPLPAAHFAAQEPPQSTAVSSWPCAPSSQRVATHRCVVPLQIAEVQSASTPQPLFTAHLAAQEPPQSTAVSSWPCKPSSHRVATHRCVVPLQIAEAQSASTPQPLPAAHLAAQEPPQSTAVSSWPCTPSSHRVATHRCVVPLQIAEVQSASTPQPLPAAHLAAQEPPQSTAVSSWPCAPSSHRVATHRCVVPLQITEAQSPSTPQPPPTAHLTAHEPPQSLPVSVPFMSPSPQFATGPRSSIWPVWSGTPSPSISTVTGIGSPSPLHSSTSRVSVVPSPATTVPSSVSSPSLLERVTSMVSVTSPVPWAESVASPVTTSTSIVAEVTSKPASKLSVTITCVPEPTSRPSEKVALVDEPIVRVTLLPSSDTLSACVTPPSPGTKLVSTVAANPGPASMVPALPPSDVPRIATDRSPRGRTMVGDGVSS